MAAVQAEAAAASILGDSPAAEEPTELASEGVELPDEAPSEDEPAAAESDESAPSDESKPESTGSEEGAAPSASERAAST